MGTMIRRERLGETPDSALPKLAVRTTLPLSRTVWPFDAGFAVPAWRDARLAFGEATLYTLAPVEWTVTRIMLTPAPIGAVITYSLVWLGAMSPSVETPALTLPSDQMGRCDRSGC